MIKFPPLGWRRSIQPLYDADFGAKVAGRYSNGLDLHHRHHWGGM